MYNDGVYLMNYLHSVQKLYSLTHVRSKGKNKQDNRHMFFKDNFTNFIKDIYINFILLFHQRVPIENPFSTCHLSSTYILPHSTLFSFSFIGMKEAKMSLSDVKESNRCKENHIETSKPPLRPLVSLNIPIISLSFQVSAAELTKKIMVC